MATPPKPPGDENRLESVAKATATCAFCPSLCKHTCPVGTVTARESATPWAMMSVVDHLRTGRAELTDTLARTLYLCNGCRACTDFCVHHVDVEGALVEARAWAVERGVRVFPEQRFVHPDLTEDQGALREVRASERYEVRPVFSLFPGRATLEHTPQAVDELLSLADRLDVDALSCGSAAQHDTGYDLWFAGHHDAFLRQARSVVDAVSGAQDLVVMSPEALYMMKVVYPRYGLRIGAELLHTSEFLLPLLSGGVVERIPGRIGYHDSCHLARHLGIRDVPRQVLRRLLEEPPVELPLKGAETLCCGGTGCLTETRPDVAAAMAEEVVRWALEVGLERLVSFSPECVASLRDAAGSRLRVDHAVTLAAEAIVSDGASVV
ncbi:MAG: (Fe-S)-binding protein [Deltaproteobacteria bacterium]|nr:(Fe-S)-binding protein [Deltaproteobacteria bacterium]